MQGRYNVLFLCTGNSARSIMAEAILNRKGRPNFTAYSAGSHPSGQVRPEAVKQLQLARLPTDSLRSKDWTEFAQSDAPKMDFVFTVCDNAAKEVCPVWPGQPMTAHWGVPDPASVAGTPEQIEKAFREAFVILDRRISLFPLPPPFESRQAGDQERNRPHRFAMRTNLRGRVAAEFLGTGFLVAAIVGSGIMAERLANGNAALALLANSIATGAALVALILTFAPISGAHLNPVVSLGDALAGGLPWAETPAYIGAQILGGISGTIAANLMFGLRFVTVSHRIRGGTPQFFSEFLATFGLMCVIWGCSRSRPSMVAFAVGGYITAAYWFTSSTSFANPAVTIARSLSDTFAGIRPSDVLPFVAAQIVGGIGALMLLRWLIPDLAFRPEATR